MPTIANVSLGKIFNSGGDQTVQATVRSSSGVEAQASAPSGKSTGKAEAPPFPKGGIDIGISAFDSLLANRLRGFDTRSQVEADDLLAAFIPEVGGSVTTAVSVALARVAAKEEGVELFQYLHDKLVKGTGIEMRVPYSLGNMIGGGAHSFNSGMGVQEILASTRSKYPETNVMVNAALHKKIGEIAKKTGTPLGVNIERAWVLQFEELRALEVTREARNAMQDQYGVMIVIGMDVAAASLYDAEKGVYDYGKGKPEGKRLTTEQQLSFMQELSKVHGVLSIEDPLDEDDFEGHAALTKAIGGTTRIVGDDLYVTNADRIETGGRMGATNAVLLKVNQNGTLTGTARAAVMAHKYGMTTVTSHRSSETLDPFLTHVAIAFGSEEIKTGTVGGERMAKLNELVRVAPLVEARRVDGGVAIPVPAPI